MNFAHWSVVSRHPAFALLASAGFWTSPAAAQGADAASRSGKPFTYSLDVRQAQPNSERVGLDFELRYEQMHGARSTGDPRGLKTGISAAAKGFQDFDRTVRELNSMAGEVAAAGQYYTAATLSAADTAELGRLLDTVQTESVRNRVAVLMNRVTASRKFFAFKAHYRYETTQQITVDQHVVGAALAGEIPLLHQFLDIVPKATRTMGPGPQPIRASVSLDYVSAGVRAAADSVDANNFPRATIEMAWSTYVLNGLRLRATWQAQQLFNAPEATKALDREFNSFVQVWVIYPLGENAGLLVKYADGRLPPTYEASSTVRLGFTVSLQ